MAKLLTFLGTGKYVECHYQYDNSISVSNQYIQVCILDILFKKLGNGIDEIIIFLTPEAKEKNFFQNAKYPGKNGLQKELDEYLQKNALQTRITTIDIPSGNNKEELWEIFDALMRNIKENEIIYFDITHSFRFLPMLAFITLNYARYIKNTQVEGVFYGSIESFCQEKEITVYDIDNNIPIEERIAPLFDLTDFIQLLDWVIGAKEFITSLNYNLLQSLTSQSVKNINKTLKEKQEFIKIRELRDLSQNIKEFSDNVMLCRGLDLVESYKKLREKLSNIKTFYNDKASLEPFKYIIEKLDTTIEEKMLNQTENIHIYLKIVDLCCQNNLIQQGLTILNESLITYILEKTGKDKKNTKQREDITKLAHNIKNNNSIQNADEIKLINNLGKEIFLLIYDIGGLRNDINHCGFREYPSNCSTLEENLREFLDRAQKIIDEIEQK